MENVEEMKEEALKVEKQETTAGEGLEVVGKDAVDEEASKKEGGLSKLINKNKNATQYSGAFLLITMFCAAPLFYGFINRVMLTSPDIIYGAYYYNNYCIYLANAIYTVILLFVIINLARLAKKREFGNTIRCAYKREPWLVFWTILLVWSLIPTFHAINVVGAFFGDTMLSSGYVSYLFSIGVMICAFWLKEHEKKALIKFYVIVSDLLVLITLSFEYNIPFFKEFTAPVTGVSVYTNENHYGYYLAVAIMCMTGMFFTSLKEKQSNNKKGTIWKYIYLFSSMINMYTLILNNTLGAYLAVVFATLFLMIIWRIRFGKMHVGYWIPILFLLVLTLLSYFDIITSKSGATIGYSLVVFVADLFKLKHKSAGYELGGSRRIKIWKETIARIKEHPILGYGPDMMFDKNGNMLIETTPHNELLECAFFLGIPGLILYVGGFIRLCIDRCRGLKKLSEYQIVAAAVVLGYLMSSFFGVRKFNTSPYLYMFLGLLLLEKGQETVKNKKS